MRPWAIITSAVVIALLVVYAHILPGPGKPEPTADVSRRGRQILSTAFHRRGVEPRRCHLQPERNNQIAITA
jgi:hypothetical protein